MENQNNRKKILIFAIVYYPRFIGGSEVAIKEITDRIGSNYKFDLITMNTEPETFAKIGNVNIYRTGLYSQNPKRSHKYLFPFFAFWKAVELHKKNNYDMIWSMMANYAGFAALFFKWWNSRVPFLLTLQEGDPIDYIKRKVWFVYPIFREIFKKADKIQAISKFLGDFGKKMGHNKLIEIIPNGVDIPIFSRVFTENEKQEIKQTFGKKGGDIFLVTTSRLVYKNGIDDIISSLIYLPENITLIILGVGQEGPSLQKQANNLGLSNRVKFLGFVPHAHIPKYFSACDIFIRPSRSEGFGNSFIEAMAAGLPVVATPVGGIPDFLDDRETGIFCSPDNPQSIAKAVNLLLGDLLLRQKIIQNAKRRVVERYSWEHVAKDMKTKVFDRLEK